MGEDTEGKRGLGPVRKRNGEGRGVQGGVREAQLRVKAMESEADRRGEDVGCGMGRCGREM